MKITKAVLAYICILIFALTVSITPVYAEELPDMQTMTATAISEYHSENLSAESVGSQIGASNFISVYNAVVRVALIAGSAAIAAEAVLYIMGDEKAGAKAKSRIIIILIAVAGICLLPKIIAAGASVGSSMAWDPANPKG